MSKLIDKLNRVARAAPQPMGFRAAQSTPERSRMLLVASMAQGDNGTSGARAAADAVLVESPAASLDTKAMQKMARSLSDIPWGARLKDAGEKAADLVAEAGGDFVVFSEGSRVIGGSRLGRVLEVESSLAEGLLRAVNELPVDAVLIRDEAEGGLTWHRLMLLQRAANLLSKPILATVAPEITADEVKTLWEIGVDGLVVEAGKELTADRMKELRQAIDNAAGSKKRRRGRTEARLPSVSAGATEEAEEEEGEDDE